MFTAIYVYSNTSVSISSAEVGLSIDRFGGSSATLASPATLALGPGIYSVVSTDPLSITYSPSQSIEIVTANNKEAVPKPRPQLQTIPSEYQVSTFDEAFGAYLNDVKG